ncbi:TPA: hypothetical protein OMR03_003636, partial [Acinetobacter baumannii]|nr:hypothetical protein [Acinetobacter baumannii]HAV7139524.1 hypothetical protein [Acinetobacter baumannii]HCQ9943769.1 hypothetical protein [Acinetobacter baumannii]
IKTFLFISVLGFSLTGCVAVPILAMQHGQPTQTLNNAAYDKQTQSRLRVYSQYANVNTYTNTSCNEWSSKKIKNYFNSVMTSLPNTETISVGMPATKDSQSILKTPQKGWGPKLTFKEVILEANKPVVLDARRVETTARYTCQVAVSFTPEAGNDYEAWYSENNDTCSIKFNKITENKTDNLYSTQDFDNISMCK